MQNTFDIFEERKEEIELYFSTLELMNNDEEIQCNKKITRDVRLYKIMKSNFILMLYNLVEACVVSGLMEIKKKKKNEKCSYNQVIAEIQDIWREKQIEKVYSPTTEKKTYDKRVKDMIDSITRESPILLTREDLNIGGNLDAKKIKQICDKHRIRYHLTSKGESLYKVKQDRNSLAHGDSSFSDCERELTIDDLKKIKNDVETFIFDIIKGMDDYYKDKKFMTQKS